jgi:low temperature requirement protein LtrA
VTVTLVHTGIFLRTSQQSVVNAVRGLGPFNLLTAGMLLAAGFTSGGARWALFTAAFVVHWVTPYLSGIGGFRIRSAHFVERHGLILLIAIGESVVALGIGLGTLELPAGRIAAALLGLALAAGLWWLYFNGEEERAETALEATPEQRRPWLAVNAFGYGFLPILGGIVLVAAGIKLAVLQYEQPAALSTALLLAFGLALYLAGLALFRWLLHSGSIAVRFMLAVLALPTAFIGLGISPLAQLAALALILVAGTIAESALVRPATLS